MEDFPNEYGLYQQPEIQEEEDRKEQSETIQSLPLLDELIAELEEDLKNADSISALDLNVGMNEMTLKAALLGSERYRVSIQTKLDNLKEKRSRHIK